MLTITVQGLEGWDEKNERFVNEPSFQLHLEHSLISLSKWESKFEKAFLDDKEPKTQEEMLWYIRFMVMAPEVTFEKLSRLSVENLEEINQYIDSKQTATTFRQDPVKKGRPEKITAELIYYWMYANGIPTEWERRHLNQLFALIRVFSVKQSKSKPTKQSRSEIAAWQQQENARRRAAHNTRG